MFIVKTDDPHNETPYTITTHTPKPFKINDYTCYDGVHLTKEDFDHLFPQTKLKPLDIQGFESLTKQGLQDQIIRLRSQLTKTQKQKSVRWKSDTISDFFRSYG